MAANPPAYNWNVRVVLGFTLADGLSGGVWGYNVLSAFIFVLTGNSNTLVGWAEGLQGASQALAALPAGYLADSGRRDGVLWAAGLVGLSAVACTAYALLLAEEATYHYLCVALVLWGAYTGATNPALEALFADSVPAAGRSRVYATKFALQLGAAGVGPLLNCAAFVWLGNTWTLPELRLVFIIGVCLALIPCCMLLLFSDDATLGAASEAYGEEEEPAERDPLRGGGGAGRAGGSMRGGRGRHHGLGRPPLPPPPPPQPLLLPADAGSDEEQGLAEEGADEVTAAAPARPPVPAAEAAPMLVPITWLPAVLAASDCIFGLASGMTIKFFPVFFLHKCGLSPLAVNGVAALTPLLMAASCLGAQRLSQRLGRVQTSLCFKAAGICLLVAMALAHTLWSHAAVVVPIYVVRTVLMNSTYPLMKSLLMDYVRKAARAKWNSLESISAFGWSGSAVLGGVLLDRYDFRVTFLLTAAMQSLGWAVLLLLLPGLGSGAAAEGGGGGKAAAAGAGAEGAGGSGGDSDGLRRPLLGGSAAEGPGAGSRLVVGMRTPARGSSGSPGSSNSGTSPTSGQKPPRVPPGRSGGGGPSPPGSLSSSAGISGRGVSDAPPPSLSVNHLVASRSISVIPARSGGSGPSLVIAGSVPVKGRGAVGPLLRTGGGGGGGGGGVLLPPNALTIGGGVSGGRALGAHGYRYGGGLAEGGDVGGSGGGLAVGSPGSRGQWGSPLAQSLPTRGRNGPGWPLNVSTRRASPAMVGGTPGRSPSALDTPPSPNRGAALGDGRG